MLVGPRRRGVRTITRLHVLLKSYLSGSSENQLVNRKLVGSLYAQPTSLAFGALGGVGAAGAAAFETDYPPLVWLCVALTLVAAARMALAMWFKHNEVFESGDARKLGVVYEVGALTYAFLVGAIAATVMWIDGSAHLQTLAVSYALVYGSSIASRNAGRPVMAIGQLLLTCLPVIALAIHIGDLAMYTLAAITVFLIFGLTAITLNVFKVLREQILAADASEKMAAKMREQARTDVVTGLLNRAGLNHELVEQVMRLPKGQKLALFWLDLDRFKEINDTLGHSVGDGVLVEVGRRISRHRP